MKIPLGGLDINEMLLPRGKKVTARPTRAWLLPKRGYDVEHIRLEVSYDDRAQPVGFSIIHYDQDHEPVEYTVWPCRPSEELAAALSDAWLQIKRLTAAAGAPHPFPDL